MDSSPSTLTCTCWHHAEQEERDLVPVLRLMDAPEISPRIAALVACIEADASQRVIVHNRRIRGDRHIQPAVTGSLLKQQQQQDTSQPLLSRLGHLQQPATRASLPLKHQHRSLQNNWRVPAQQAPRKHANLEPAAAPPAAQASAEADADADADADVPDAHLYYSLDHDCKPPRFVARSRNQSEQDDSAQMQSGHLRRSDRLREAAVREAHAAQRAGRVIQSSIAERHMSCQHMHYKTYVTKLQAKIDRDLNEFRAVKRGR